jgi:homoserine O-acetyltransferase/O-succinyltransferase
MLLTSPLVRAGYSSIESFELSLGGHLDDVRVAYRLYGDVDQPVVVVLGGISAGRDIAPGWWQDFVGPSKAVDTERVAVLGIDFVGGSGASTGPNADGFPAISTQDQARALSSVLDDLGITTVSLMGASYGGMVALAFAELFAHRAHRLLVISAAHEPHPMATALRSLQRRTIRLGIATGRVAEAIAIARGIAMTTYRTSAEFAERFDSAAELVGGRFRHPVEAYIEHCGELYAQRFSPWGFLCLSQSLDLHSVEPARITAPVTAISVTADTLVPPWQMQRLADALGAPARLINLSSIYGHDAFLKETTTLSPIIATWLFGEDHV